MPVGQEAQNSPSLAGRRLNTPFLKIATAHRNNSGHMTFACDEGPSLGGLGSAPTPLMYFSAALAF
jgi:hypothetical protein